MKFVYNSLIFSALVLCFSSCVSQKKYQEALSREQSLMSQSTQQADEIVRLKGQIENLQKDNARLIGQIDEALKKYSQASGQANLTQKQLEAEQQRLLDLRKLLQQQSEAVENLRKKMADALTGFNSNELTVFTKNGRVYVSLQESLLFPSGSAVVNEKGKQALATLAQALNNSPDINVVVEGHTDSIPIRKTFEDNWALSVARATSIVRLLTNTYAVDPTRVTASGRSYFEPVDTNSTPEGRQRNRRTEIILAPKLDQILQLLQQSKAATEPGTN
ncbi:OmpA/MotB family protein [Flavisolibacter ginsenosidimutans]|uniref:OmpA family protein n=1 Tax=Flavisolibacter ginsenosidimutans TaxID=661481 RepID=A0A5B8UL81_9BACT|nr:flagellar motor protein MotB [Flavisolibacter ginsenosidimutans]QEC57427.1 OmpA family protein [Flavisolibacter ginsenosidimutans]